MTRAAAGNGIALPVTLLLATALAQGPLEIGGCPVFPADSIWNTPVDGLPVDANSAAYVATIGAGAEMHPDFGSGLWEGCPIGIPFVVVPGSQPRIPASFLYDDQSDAGGYAIPLDAPIEEGSQSDGDRHAIALDRDNCILYTPNADNHLLSRPFYCGLCSELSNGGLPGSKD